MYYNKVQICGIDTSTLKVLKESEKTELLLKAKQGDAASRDKLVLGNLRLVLSVIQRFSNRGENLDDLFQVGCIGLMKAIDNFDTDNHDVRFSTYAVPMIIGEVRRHLRDNNPVRVSRSMRDTAYHAMKAREKLNNELGREPTIEEIAKELGKKKSEVVVALEAIVEPVSFYEPVFSNGEDTIFLMDQLGSDECDGDWIDEISMKEAIKDLPQREKKILSMRFMMGMTQTEVAEEIGISQAQVSRLEKSAIERVKGN
ncbi:MAG: RNA polymerase sporulation sigma factor SigG [Oscillospiraceae bacterium]|nr:RNA polymerase sporulation sigma factor SigG [Oscillospiraceae bacterium]